MKTLQHILIAFYLFSMLPINGQEIKSSSNSANINVETSQALRGEAALTKSIVRDYIVTRIEDFKLHKEIRSQGNVDDKAIRKYYSQREILLIQMGWEVEEFENTENRINQVLAGLKIESHISSDAEFQNEIKEINSNPYLTEKQKKATIELLELDRENRRATFVDPIQKDRPAVMAYIKELRHLKDYLAENRSDPPVLRD
ncbi:hypothetical protein NMK71_08095 [Weeksellaceae bacterium KMM 9713]|uniref:Uncharacterized protein n=1 Tax=Profundicola chukchiensis TaxID=2961959 RepID=A0A9X4MZA6_9FLAO|nr:hypothetical protein [Profundicola chukchiensis]MDG4946372.1 hypothetical protein [Profundicola chukchiensis]